MLTLLTFAPALGSRCPSPFGLKAEALLALSNLPYQLEYADVRKAPRQKLPVLKVGDRLIPDTAHIQAYLENEEGVDFDSSLSDEELAISTAMRGMVENHLYFLNIQFRWEEHGDLIQEAFFGEAPSLLRGMIFRMVQKQVLKTVYLHGTARHTREQRIDLATADLRAISTLLGDRPFIFGDQPTSVDASTYGMIANLLDFGADVPASEVTKSLPNLVAYNDRCREQFFKGRLPENAPKAAY